ncbi:helix-turn-helix transcriptional regulator [Patulibacter americanus]|uniref:helix-turn-helix transcriptional regulator n=1 Tax=Patulibacter americanus TaxID=588672 RepID=UPI0003B317D4|nr:helix-turn-helix domain-containing protein [Patulibacter americanus]
MSGDTEASPGGAAPGEPTWGFLTNHAQVLLAVAADPDARLREVGERVGITERAAHRIVTELEGAGYLVRERVGRRNRYTVNPHEPLPDAMVRDGRVGALLSVLGVVDVLEDEGRDGG